MPFTYIFLVFSESAVERKVEDRKLQQNSEDRTS